MKFILFRNAGRCVDVLCCTVNRASMELSGTVENEINLQRIKFYKFEKQSVLLVLVCGCVCWCGVMNELKVNRYWGLGVLFICLYFDFDNNFFVELVGKIWRFLFCTSIVNESSNFPNKFNKKIIIKMKI
jgi:hypothetical protein